MVEISDSKTKVSCLLQTFPVYMRPPEWTKMNEGEIN